MQNPEHNLWFLHLVTKLLQEDAVSSDVHWLLASNPFEGRRPPKFIKCDLYRYDFTRWTDWPVEWYTRRFVRPYLPMLALNDSVIRQVMATFPPVPQ